MSEYGRISHVIFDVDGLLLDTESIYTRMMEAIAEPHGKQFTWSLKLKMMGRKEQEAAQVFIDGLNIPITVEEYLSQLKSLMEKYFPLAKLMPGAERLVRHLHLHGVPIALATGSDSHSYGLKTQHHTELFSLFSHAVFSSEDRDVKNGKPAPDCFQVASARFDQAPDQPAQVLVFEDAPNGVQAAVSAGMQVVWVPDPNVSASSLSPDHSPTQTLRSLEDFKPELFGIPAY